MTGLQVWIIIRAHIVCSLTCLKAIDSVPHNRVLLKLQLYVVGGTLVAASLLCTGMSVSPTKSYVTPVYSGVRNGR